MQTSELYDEVFLAQQRNKKAMANLLKKFRPLIKKYKCALNYDDAESELLISFIEMIYNINLKEFNVANNQYQLLPFIKRSLYNEFVILSKKHYKYETAFFYIDQEHISSKIYSVKNQLLISDCSNLLTLREKWIILLYNFQGFSDVEISQKLGVTRSVVNRCTNHEITKMRKRL